VNPDSYAAFRARSLRSDWAAAVDEAAMRAVPLDSLRQRNRL
jgi:hypothetical protein